MCVLHAQLRVYWISRDNHPRVCCCLQTEPIFAFIWQLVFFRDEKPSDWTLAGLLVIIVCVTATSSTQCVEYFSALLGRYCGCVLD